MRSLLFLFVSLTFVSGSSWNKFIHKYASIQLLSDCLGQKYMMEWHRNYTKAVDTCYQEDPEESARIMYTSSMPLPSVSPMFGYQQPQSQIQQLNVQPVNPADIDLNTMQAPGVVNMNELFKNVLEGTSNGPFLLVPLPQDIFQPAIVQPTNRDGIQSRQEYFFRRVKRDHPNEPHFNEEKIAEIHAAILMKASNFTCVVRKLKLFDTNYDVNLRGMLTQLEELNLNAQLELDLMEGITDCIKFTECKPLKTMTFAPSAVQRAASFMKCHMKQQMAACVKNDLREKQHKFDKEALNKFGNNEFMDEGDKMFALIYGELMGGKKKF